MRCLYCNRSMGFFRSADKGSFCSVEHEELYRQAAALRLEHPYARSNKAPEDSTNPVSAEVSQTQDLAELLNAVQAGSAANVEAPLVTASIATTTPVEAFVESSRAATKVRMLGGGDSSSPPPPGASVALADVHAEPVYSGSDSAMRSRPKLTVSVSATVEVEQQSGTVIMVACLRDLQREMNCSLVARSGEELEFNSDCELAEGEVILAELADHLILAEVKRSRIDGNTYAISAECVTSIPRNDAPSPSTPESLVELLIKAMCEGGGKGPSEREKALEKAARILEIWRSGSAPPVTATEAAGSLSEPEGESVDAEAATPAEEIEPAEPKPSLSGRKMLLAAASAVVLMALLMVYLFQFRSRNEAPATAAQHPAPIDSAAKIPSPTPEPQKPTSPPPQTPAVVQPTPAAPATPAVASTATSAGGASASAAGEHRVEIRALQSTWVGASSDGSKIFAGMIMKGETKELEYTKFGYLHVGNAAGVEITVDGRTVPMGTGARSALRLVELTASGFRFVRWSNDDPPQP